MAYDYLARNIRENGVDGRVLAECGNCRDLLRGEYDRLVLGHFDSPDYLPDALCHARSGSVLHLHTLRDETGRIRSLGPGCRFCR